jgi:hypothetical protein
MSLISVDGVATAGFLTTNAAAWAVQQMRDRYKAASLDADASKGFPAACMAHLREEYRVLRGWFNEAGVFQPLLHSAFLNRKTAGPLGDGISWDFDDAGELDGRMLLFKGTLIATSRAAALVPVDQRGRGNMQFGGIASMIRSAYTTRAQMHNWTSAEIARRWIAKRTFFALMELGADPEWSWDTARCPKAFGATDDPLDAISQIFKPVPED